jgi:catechol 2,3-dioxygenase-like lactoylglutathione lyase family enzyme
MKAAQLSVLAALSALAAEASAFAPGTALASRQGVASGTLDWVSHPQIARAYSTAERGEVFTNTACQARRAGMEECRTDALRGSVIFLYSDDVARSRQFWGADLGLPVVADKESVVFFKLPQAGGSLAVVKQGVSAADTPPVCARDAGKDVVMVCMLTDDVEGWSARMEGAGHRLDQPPRQNERFGIKNALLRSPEGYLVEIQQFLDPAEQALFTT